MCERIFGILLLLSVCLHASSHYTQGGCLSVRFLLLFVSAELWQREKEGVSISYIIFSDLVKSEDDPEKVLSRTVISLVSCPALQYEIVQNRDGSPRKLLTLCREDPAEIAMVASRNC